MTKIMDKPELAQELPQDVDNRQFGDQESTISPSDLQDIPPAYRGHYRKALSGRSRKASIRTHCLQCVGWNASEVRRCTSPKCPLYPFRITG